MRQARIHKLETKAVKRREREIWLRRIRRAFFLVFIASASVGTVSMLAGSRIVADGIVRANVVTETAKSRVRVGAWLVRAGSSVAKGEPIARLEAAESSAQGEVLAASLKAAEAQLAWFDAGGERLAEGQEQRMDRAVAARRSEALERAQVAILLEALGVRVAEAELAQAGLAEIQRDAEARKALLAAQAGALGEVRLQREIEARQAVDDEARTRQLGAEGIQSRRDVEFAEAQLAASDARVRSSVAAVEALAVESEGVDRVADAARARAAREVEVRRAQIEEAQAAVDAARARAAAFASEAKHHEALDRGGEYDPRDVRAARRIRLAADVAVARAALEAHRKEAGARVLLAASSGIVDEVFAVEGAIVEGGARLLRYYDSTTAQIVVYASPSATSALAVGDKCLVRCPADGRSVEAQIQSIGHVWIDAPGEAERAGAPKRVAVTLAFDSEVSPFSANAAIKAAFRTDRWTAIKERVLAWFEG